MTVAIEGRPDQLRPVKSVKRDPARISRCRAVHPHTPREIRSYKGYNFFMLAIAAPEAGSYPYAGTGYANPHAVKSDSKRPIDNDLFLRSERQSLPKDDRRRNHNISLGLCKPSHWPRLRRRNHYLRLRCLRVARLPVHCYHHDPLPIQVVLGRVIHGQRRHIRDDHGVPVQW